MLMDIPTLFFQFKKILENSDELLDNLKGVCSIATASRDTILAHCWVLARDS